MITVQALDNLQKAAPETSIVSLNTPFSGFCTIGIEPPKVIVEYFREYLLKAKEYTSGSECRIDLYHGGDIDIKLVLPDRVYRIMPDASKPVYRIYEIPQDGSKHQEIIKDPLGHEKIVSINDKVKAPQELYTEERPLP